MNSSPKSHLLLARLGGYLCKLRQDEIVQEYAVNDNTMFWRRTPARNV
jgi:hypothetical protein